MAPKSNHHFISYAQELWNQGIDPELFIVLMSQKKAELESHTFDSVHALKNLAKYPPTLGMTGTVMGMISLFSSLDDNKNSVGTALSVAMTATFMGLILANILISPLADRLHVRHVNQQRMLENMYELLLLINQGEPSALIREELNERAI
jgi:chemotaxis protein MotA